MIHLAATCLALCALQDPDRSTPEKAFESFNAFWDGVQGSGERFMKTLEEIEALGDFLRTDELKAARAKKREESARMYEDFKTLSTTHSISGTSEGKDGAVTVEARQKVRRRTRNFATNQVEEVEETLPRRVVFVKSGAVWLVREEYLGCFMCKATGDCLLCKGTGKSYGVECSICKGKKVCNTCSGEKLPKRNLAGEGIRLVIPDGELKYATDLSTPQASAQAYADVLLRRDVETTARVKAAYDGGVAKMRLHLVPDVVKAVEENFASRTEQGRRRFKETAPRVESVEEKGGETYAVVVTPWTTPS